jgi:hypothetical protein
MNGRAKDLKLEAADVDVADLALPVLILVTLLELAPEVLARVGQAEGVLVEKPR